jgi:hypothetical protein
MAFNGADILELSSQFDLTCMRADKKSSTRSGNASLPR